MEGSIPCQCSGFKRVLQSEEDRTDRYQCGGSLGFGVLVFAVLVFAGFVGLRV